MEKYFLKILFGSFMGPHASVGLRPLGAPDDEMMMMMMMMIALLFEPS